MNKLLLIDLGGTNLRYAFSEGGLNDLHGTKKIALDTIPNFDEFISNLLNESGSTKLVISAAGPKINGTISMTNRDLVVDEKSLQVKHNLDSCFLLNDWESIGYSLSNIEDVEIDYIKQGNPFNGNTFFIGPGTGLGAALKTDNGKVIPTEIGNSTGLTSSLLKNYSINDEADIFVTLENVVSGSAISKIYEYKTGLKGKYYNAEGMNKKKKMHTERVDPKISFDFREKAPYNEMNPKKFSIYWEGSILPRETGWYEFFVKSPNGFALRINKLDGRPSIDERVTAGVIRESKAKIVAVFVDENGLSSSQEFPVIIIPKGAEIGQTKTYSEKYYEDDKKFHEFDKKTIPFLREFHKLIKLKKAKLFL